MAIPLLPSLDRTSSTFAADLDALFLTQLPATIPAFNTAAAQVDANTITTTAQAALALEKADIAYAAMVAAQAALVLANAAAASAVNSPGTSATSTSSLTIGAGLQTLTVQTGKSFFVGQTIVLAVTADAANTQMSGPITAYNSGTGVLTIAVPTGAFSGSGTYAAWTVSLTAAVVATAAIVNAASTLALATLSPAALDAALVNAFFFN